MQLEIDPNNIPKHVAIIMDGNGRWAKQHNQPRIFGHRNAVNAVSTAIEYATKNNIKSLTLYAFSSENWQRPLTEVSSLMDLFLLMLNKQTKILHKNNIKLKILGDLSKFNVKLQKKISDAETLTKNNTKMNLNIAANYGGRWDIINATNKIINDVQNGNITHNISEETFDNYLSTYSQNDVDLVIRTSGEKRISNFLLWQIAYAELYFTETLWPDFNAEDFHKAIIAYQTRSRRFGK